MKDKNKEYVNYLNSEAWKALRSKAYKNAENLCELCKSDAYAVHHIRYPKDFDKDNLSNLLVVCNECHDKLHGDASNLVNKNLSIILDENIILHDKLKEIQGIIKKTLKIIHG